MHWNRLLLIHDLAVIRAICYNQVSVQAYLRVQPTAATFLTHLLIVGGKDIAFLHANSQKMHHMLNDIVRGDLGSGTPSLVQVNPWDLHPNLQQICT